MGSASWLLSISQSDQNRPISDLERRVVAPLMLRQLRIFKKGDQPLAFITWAYASPEVASKIQEAPASLTLEDWRSGTVVKVVDCVSPFTDGQKFVDHFLAKIPGNPAAEGSN